MLFAAFKSTETMHQTDEIDIDSTAPDGATTPRRGGPNTRANAMAPDAEPGDGQPEAQRRGGPNTRANAMAPDVEPGNGQPEARNEILEFAIFLLAFVFLALTLCFGVVGAVKTQTDPAKDAPSDIFEDSAFSLLMSQAAPNIHHGILELIKAWTKANASWQSRLVYSSTNGLIIALSAAAPIFYATKDRAKPWTQVITIILSMSTAFCIILMGLIEVLKARRRNPEDLRIQADSSRADLEANKLELDKVLKDIESLRAVASVLEKELNEAEKANEAKKEVIDDMVDANKSQSQAEGPGKTSRLFSRLTSRLRLGRSPTDGTPVST